MPAAIPFAAISICGNQHGSFGMRFVPSAGDSLVGARVSCEFRASAQPATPLMVPSVDTEIESGTGALLATFSWTKEQSQAIPAMGARWDSVSTYQVEVDLFFPDDVILGAGESLRFVSTAKVSPGGNQT